MVRIGPFNFTWSWRKDEGLPYFPTHEPSETKVRADMQFLFNEIKDFINGTLLSAVNDISAADVMVQDAQGAELLSARLGGIADDLARLEEEIQGTAAGAIPDGSLTGAKFQNESIPPEKLEPNSISAPQMANLSVGTPQLVDQSVTGPKVADQTLTTGKYADGSITADKIGVGAVTERHLDSALKAKVMAADYSSEAETFSYVTAAAQSAVSIGELTVHVYEKRAEFYARLDATSGYDGNLTLYLYLGSASRLPIGPFPAYVIDGEDKSVSMKTLAARGENFVEVDVGSVATAMGDTIYVSGSWLLG